ncbi:MAG: hypothetical protein OCD76_03815 [Reichenbachiella sp.]
MMKMQPYTLIYFAIIGLLIISACSDDPEESLLESTITFTQFQVSDIENLNNSADIYLRYAIGGDINTIDELRLLFSKSILSPEEALQIERNNYQRLTISQSLQTSLDENLTDTEGDMIEEGTSYQTYLLGVFQNDKIAPILSEVSTITLNNEILVTTPVLTGSFNASEDIVIGSDGTLYANGGGVSEKNLYKVTPEGVSTVLSNTQNGAVGITLDEDGNIYSSNYNSRVIQKVTPSGQASDFVSNSLLIGGGGLAFDNDGNLFNTFWAETTLFRIVDQVVEPFTTSAAFNGPVGVTYDKESEKLFVASFNSGKIFHISTDDGSVTEVADTPASIGHITYANGYFYVSGWNEHQVFQVSLDGQTIVTIGSGVSSHIDGTASTAGFVSPNGIEATSDGKHVYVTQGNGRLRKIIMARED